MHKRQQPDISWMTVQFFRHSCIHFPVTWWYWPLLSASTPASAISFAFISGFVLKGMPVSDLICSIMKGQLFQECCHLSAGTIEQIY